MSVQTSNEKENSEKPNQTQRISIKNVTKLTTFAKNIPIGIVVPTDKDGKLVAGRTPLEELRQWKNVRCSEAVNSATKVPSSDENAAPPTSDKRESKEKHVPPTTTIQPQIVGATPTNTNTTTEQTIPEASLPNDLNRTNNGIQRIRTTQPTPSPPSRAETHWNSSETDPWTAILRTQQNQTNNSLQSLENPFFSISRKPKQAETPFYCDNVFGYNTPIYYDSHCYEAPRRQTMKESQFMSNPSGNQSVQALPGIGRVNGERLSSAGYGNVSDLRRKCSGMSEAAITNWMTNECGVNRRYASTCAKAMRNTSSSRKK